MFRKIQVTIVLIGAFIAIFSLSGTSLAKAANTSAQMGQAPVQIYYIYASPQQAGGSGAPQGYQQGHVSVSGSAGDQMSQEELMEKYRIIQQQQQQQAQEQAQARAHRQEEPSFWEKMATKLVPLAIAKYAMDIPIQGILTL